MKSSTHTVCGTRMATASTLSSSEHSAHSPTSVTNAATSQICRKFAGP